jgi:hypothetical protein
MPANPLTIAAEYGCSVRTVARWKREGAPLDDPIQTRAWLATRKNLPAATRAKLATEAKRRRTRIASESDAESEAVGIGAAAALRRLEQSEAESYNLLQSAIREGEPMEIKCARENWLKIGDSLRRYDLLVEKGRRDAGELIPREEIEGHISAFVRFFKIACLRLTNSLAPQLGGLSVADIHDVLKRAILEDILLAFAAIAVRPCAARLPDWFISSATGPMADTLVGADEATKARAHALDAALTAMAEESARQITAEPDTETTQIPPETNAPKSMKVQISSVDD